MAKIDYEQTFRDGFEMYRRYPVQMLLSSVVVLLIGALSFGILALPLWTALWKMAIDALARGKEPKIGDVFAYLNKTLPLFIFAIIVTVPIIIGLAFFLLPGLILGFLLPAWWFFVPILIVEQDMPLMEAMSSSKQRVTESGIWDYVIFLVIVSAIFALAGSFLIGVILATPLFAGMYARVYIDEYRLATDTEPEDDKLFVPEIDDE
jgi:hypothetical protein